MASTRFFAVALLVIFTLNAFLLQTESVNCCLSYTKRYLHCQRINKFTIQNKNGFCDLDAIMNDPAQYVGEEPLATPETSDTGSGSEDEDMEEDR
ncbi:hypothetical protein JZ751_015479 [Albula glossodonta]|uniref:Chemokine interleukin-8-like domain-containing protein n=1 Tax=Albula glossodonta TaxID=121402 RepID=A0A8T2MLA6_9TELE|nr:hypothetical protein JZ751_015479 [Albula glossodonta]